MNLQSIQPGDIVRVDKKGRIFLAEVTEKVRGKLKLSPITPSMTYYEASAREVTAHWKRRKNGTG